MRRRVILWAELQEPDGVAINPAYLRGQLEWIDVWRYLINWDDTSFFDTCPGVTLMTPRRRESDLAALSLMKSKAESLRRVAERIDSWTIKLENDAAKVEQRLRRTWPSWIMTIQDSVVPDPIGMPPRLLSKEQLDYWLQQANAGSADWSATDCFGTYLEVAIFLNQRARRRLRARARRLEQRVAELTREVACRAVPIILTEDGYAYFLETIEEETFSTLPQVTTRLRKSRAPENPAIALANGDDLLGDVPGLRLSAKPEYEPFRAVLKAMLQALATDRWTESHTKQLMGELSRTVSRGIVPTAMFDWLNVRAEPGWVGDAWDDWLTDGIRPSEQRIARALGEVTEVDRCFSLYGLGLLNIAELVTASGTGAQCRDCQRFLDPLPRKHRNRLCNDCKALRRRVTVRRAVARHSERSKSRTNHQINH